MTTFPKEDPDSKLAEIYREPIQKLKQEQQTERSRTKDVDLQMKIGFQAIFRLEQRMVALEGTKCPPKLREKLGRKLQELNDQQRELQVFRDRCTASMRRVEEDIQRVRDRQKYDAFLDSHKVVEKQPSLKN